MFGGCKVIVRDRDGNVLDAMTVDYGRVCIGEEDAARICGVGVDCGRENGGLLAVGCLGRTTKADCIG